MNGQHLVDTRHGRMAVHRRGAGPPVLLLHGIPGGAAAWDPVADRLAGHADVLAPDLLGFGASDRPVDLATLHARAQAEALADVLRALGVAEATVVGHDFGGPVALMLTRVAPDTVGGLGLLAANVFPDTPVPMPLAAVRWPGIGRVAAAALFSRPSLALMLQAGTGRPRVRLDRRVHLGDPRQIAAIRTIFEGSLRDLAALYAPVQAQLQTWTGPAAVGWGDRDPFFPPQQGRRTALACGARFVLLPGAGHFLPGERPDEVASLIADLLDARRARAAAG